MSKIKPETVEEMKYLRSQGLNDIEIAVKIKCSRETVNIYLNERQDRRNFASKEPKAIPKLDEIITDAEEIDYSKLPKETLFDYKNFPSF